MNLIKQIALKLITQNGSGWLEATKKHALLRIFVFRNCFFGVFLPNIFAITKKFSFC